MPVASPSPIVREQLQITMHRRSRFALGRAPVGVALLLGFSSIVSPLAAELDYGNMNLFDPGYNATAAEHPATIEQWYFAIRQQPLRFVRDRERN